MKDLQPTQVHQIFMVPSSLAMRAFPLGMPVIKNKIKKYVFVKIDFKFILIYERNLCINLTSKQLLETPNVSTKRRVN